MLTELSRSRKAPKREVDRASVLLKYADGQSVTQIQQQTGLSKPTIVKCLDKALATGVQTGLKDKYHRPYEPEITMEAKNWVTSVACTKPKDVGLAAEVWSIAELAKYIGAHAQAEGFDRLSNAGKSTVWRILNENQLKPHKIRYYLEKRDPDFNRKMNEVLMIYKDVGMYAPEAAVRDARS